MSGISIGTYISDILLNDEHVKSFVDDKVFPDVVTRDIEFPFIVYEFKVTTRETKDGRGPDDVTASIRIGAASRINSAHIAESVRSALDHKRSATYGVMFCKMLSADPFFEDGTYVFELIFKITVK